MGRFLMNIINGPGNYKTRDGRLVVIHVITSGSTWEAKGIIFTPRAGRKDRGDFDIWNTNGMWGAVKDCARDIVSKAIV